jgi:hypothetical protein
MVELLGEPDRLALGQHDHAGGEAYPIRHGGKVGQGHNSFESRLVGRVAKIARGQRDMVADPQ